jgi:hypothetical protein
VCRPEDSQLLTHIPSQVLQPPHAPNCYHKLGARSCAGCICKGLSLFTSFQLNNRLLAYSGLTRNSFSEYKTSCCSLICHRKARSVRFIQCMSLLVNNMNCASPSLFDTSQPNKLPLRSLPFLNPEFLEPQSPETLRKLVVY